MKRRTAGSALLLVLAAVVLLPMWWDAAASAPAPDPSASVLVRRGNAAGLSYLELVTGGRADRPLPLVLFIHGLGGRVPSPKDAIGLAPHVPARVIMPQATDPYLDGYAWFPMRTRDGDVSGLAQGASDASRRLMHFVTEVTRHRPTRGPSVVTGFSQGGIIAFTMAVQYPALFRHAIPVSGWLPPPLWPSSAPPDGSPTICAIHGTADRVVPFGPTRDAVTHLATTGYAAELEPIDGAGHIFTDEVVEAVVLRLETALSQTGGGCPVLEPIRLGSGPKRRAIEAARNASAH